MERLRAWREKKRQERVMTSSPTPPSVSLPQSPRQRDAKDRSDAGDQSDHAVNRNDDVVDRRDEYDAVGRLDDAGDRSDDAVDQRDDAVDQRDDAGDRCYNLGDQSNQALDRPDDTVDGNSIVDRSDPRDGSYDARDPSNTGTLLPTTGATLRTEGTASEKLVTVAGSSPQQLNRPRPRKVYNPAGRKHIPQNPLYKTPTYK